MPSSAELFEVYSDEPFGLLPYSRSGSQLRTRKEVVYSQVPYGVESHLVSTYLQYVAERLRESRWRAKSPKNDPTHYTGPIAEVFQVASKQYPLISVNPEVMAGAPCLRNTRIPVYMILDAVEYYGNLEGALRSYPSITLQQVKDAIGF